MPDISNSMAVPNWYLKSRELIAPLVQQYYFIRFINKDIAKAVQFFSETRS